MTPGSPVRLTSVARHFTDCHTRPGDLLSKVCKTVKLLAGFLQCNGGKLEEAETFNLSSSFIVCSS